jgi:hypothetical protein
MFRNDKAKGSSACACGEPLKNGAHTPTDQCIMIYLEAYEAAISEPKAEYAE